MKELLPAIVNAILPIVALLVTLLFAYLTKVVSERMKSGSAKDAALELVSAAEIVVRSLEQELKPKLIEASADGKLSPADFDMLKRQAMIELREQFSDQGQKVLKSNGTRIEEALSRAIEAQVNKSSSDPVTLITVAESKVS